MSKHFLKSLLLLYIYVRGTDGHRQKSYPPLADSHVPIIASVDRGARSSSHVIHKVSRNATTGAIAADSKVCINKKLESEASSRY